MSRDLATIRNALTDEDEIAHGEAWNPVTSDLMGICAYCNADWPCRTQRGIERLLALLADTPSVEPGGVAALERVKAAIMAAPGFVPHLTCYDATAVMFAIDREIASALPAQASDSPETT